MSDFDLMFTSYKAELESISPVPICYIQKGREVLFFNGERHGLKDANYGTCHEEFILISTAGRKIFHLNSIAHEVGHAKCRQSNCFCFSLKEGFMREAHAMLFSLRFALNHNWRPLVTEAVKDIRRLRGHKNQRYSMGAEYCMLLTEFKKAERDFVDK